MSVGSLKGGMDYYELASMDQKDLSGEGLTEWSIMC